MSLLEVFGDEFGVGAVRLRRLVGMGLSVVVLSSLSVLLPPPPPPISLLAAAEASAATGVDFSGVTWSWHSGGRHLIPSGVPDGRVVADAGGGTAGQTNVWRRANGSGLIRVLSREDLSGATFTTAGLSKVLSYRRDVRGVGLYVAGVTAKQIETIESADGADGAGGGVGPRSGGARQLVPRSDCAGNPGHFEISGAAQDVERAWSQPAGCTFSWKEGSAAFGSTASWITFKEDFVGLQNALFLTFSVEENPSVHSSRSAEIWAVSDSGATRRTTVTQRAAPSVPLVHPFCGGFSCANSVGVYTGGTVRVYAGARDLAGDDLSYTWELDPDLGVGAKTGRFDPVPTSGSSSVTFLWNRTDVSATTVRVTVSDGDTSTEDVTASVQFRPMNCDGYTTAQRHGVWYPAQSDDPADRSQTGRARFTRGPDHGCESPGTSAFVAYDGSGTRADWVTVTAASLSGDADPGYGFEHYLDFRLDPNTGTADRIAKVRLEDSPGVRLGSWPADNDIVIRQRGTAYSTHPACQPAAPVADAGAARSYSVGGYYRMEGMTQNWTHLGIGPDGGGCASDGIRLSSAGVTHVCGHNGDASVCTGSAGYLSDANRTEPRTVTDSGQTVAELVAVRVRSLPETGCTPTLKVRNDGDDWIHLHFGCTHYADGRSWYPGDLDYRDWGLTNETLSWEYDADNTGDTPTWASVATADETKIPGAVKSTHYPGSWSLNCDGGTSQRRVHGWRVSASATHNATTKQSTTSTIVCKTS